MDGRGCRATHDNNGGLLQRGGGEARVAGVMGAIVADVTGKGRDGLGGRRPRGDELTTA